MEYLIGIPIALAKVPRVVKNSRFCPRKRCMIGMGGGSSTALVGLKAYIAYFEISRPSRRVTVPWSRDSYSLYAASTPSFLPLAARRREERPQLLVFRLAPALARRANYRIYNLAAPGKQRIKVPPHLSFLGR